MVQRQCSFSVIGRVLPDSGKLHQNQEVYDTSCDNEGHIFVKITNDSRDGKSLVVNAGDKFAQAIFLPYGITYDDAASGIRNGGFGSTNTPHVIEFGQAEKVG